MRSLVDVNVLLALLDEDHVDHERAWDWMEPAMGNGWASCAITQNGFVRIVTQPRYPSPLPLGRAIKLLADACTTVHHEYWGCSVSLLDDAVVDSSRLHGHRQVTDAYLLALATYHGGRLVTFDQAVPLSAVRGARSQNLVVI